MYSIRSLGNYMPPAAILEEMKKGLDFITALSGGGLGFCLGLCQWVSRPATPCSSLHLSLRTGSKNKLHQSPGVRRKSLLQQIGNSPFLEGTHVPARTVMGTYISHIVQTHFDNVWRQIIQTLNCSRQTDLHAHTHTHIHANTYTHTQYTPCLCAC